MGMGRLFLIEKPLPFLATYYSNSPIHTTIGVSYFDFYEMPEPILMPLEEMITSHPEVFGFITFLAGGLLGNRYAIGRDTSSMRLLMKLRYL